MTIFIPLGSGAKERDNWELKYALRSIQSNFLGEVDIVIYGDPDCRPTWLKNTSYKEIERYYPDGLEEKYGFRKYENYFAVLNKVEKFLEEAPEKFVYMYDDQLLIKPISSFDYLEGVVVGYFKDRKSQGFSRHEETIKIAIDLAHQDKHHNGLSQAETHLPRVFEAFKLKRLFHKFPLSKQAIPYALNTLYFNLYYDSPSVMLMKENKIKGSFHWDDNPQDITPLKSYEIDEAAREYDIFNYTDKGLFSCDHLLRKWIEDKFNVKSKYEL